MSISSSAKWSLIALAALFLAYVAWVVEFEYSLGTNQPMGGNSIVIATYNDDDQRHERVLSLRKVDGNDYVAANHWPRAWYQQALDNPNVEVKMAGSAEFEPYLAVPLAGEEDALLREEYALSFRARAQMGFPPRYFMRLDPR